MLIVIENIHYIHILLIILYSRHHLKSKNQGNPTSTAKDIHKTSLNIQNNFLLHHIAFKSEETRIYR